MESHVVFLTIMFSMKASAEDLIDNSLDSTSKFGVFSCKNGQFISALDLCDGYKDCSDGSDETENQCYDRICPPGISFQCAYGGCIELESKCDRNIDCVDESDEDQELCGYKEPIGSRCEIPKRFPNGQCNVIGCLYGEWLGLCKDLLDPTGVCLQFTCNHGYVIEEYRNLYNSSCVNGRWSPQIPNCIECATKIDVEPLIFQGSVRKHIAPWHIGFFNLTDPKRSIFCGGTIVHSKAIVTAAHCVKRIDDITKDVYDPTDTEMGLAVGKYTSNYSLQETGVQWLEVEKVFANPDYNHEYYKDIAVIKVKKKIKFGQNAKPICLNTDKFFPMPVQGKVVGWGSIRDDENYQVSEVLREANFSVSWERKECQEALVEDHQKYISKDKFCIEKRPGMSSVEQGDSGSGFITRFKNHYYLYGLVSLKIGSVRAFTNVSFHNEWLLKTIDFN